MRGASPNGVGRAAGRRRINHAERARASCRARAGGGHAQSYVRAFVEPSHLRCVLRPLSVAPRPDGGPRARVRCAHHSRVQLVGVALVLVASRGGASAAVGLGAIGSIVCSASRARVPRAAQPPRVDEHELRRAARREALIGAGPTRNRAANHRTAERCGAAADASARAAQPEVRIGQRRRISRPRSELRAIKGPRRTSGGAAANANTHAQPQRRGRPRPTNTPPPAAPPRLPQTHAQTVAYCTATGRTHACALRNQQRRARSRSKERAQRRHMSAGRAGWKVRAEKAEERILRRRRRLRRRGTALRCRTERRWPLGGER